MKNRHPKQKINTANFSIESINNFKTSKTGLISWQCVIGKKRIKIFEAYSEAHAELISKITSDERLKDSFPAFLNSEGRYCFTEWEEGKLFSGKRIQSNKILLNRVMCILVKLHETNYLLDKDLPDYVEIVTERFHRYIGPFMPSSSMQAMFSIIREHGDRTQAKVHHPDITPSNIIWSGKANAPIVIDNELLSVSSWWLIDLFNMAFAFSNTSTSCERIIRSYVENGGNLEPLKNNPGFFLALWGIRRSGSLLQAGAVQQAFQFAQDFYKKWEYLDHPIITAVRKVG